MAHRLQHAPLHACVQGQEHTLVDNSSHREDVGCSGSNDEGYSRDEQAPVQHVCAQRGSLCTPGVQDVRCNMVGYWPYHDLSRLLHPVEQCDSVRTQCVYFMAWLECCPRLLVPVGLTEPQTVLAQV